MKKKLTKSLQIIRSLTADNAIAREKDGHCNTVEQNE